jgi:eukaryotic-like serine/threonine-protein kinase
MGDPVDGTLELPSLDAAPSSPPPAALAMHAAGDRIGRYELVEVLGAGGMGIVYAATDTVLGRRVALKLLRPGYGGETGAARLVREAQSLARLSHPNVVSVFDVGTEGSTVYIAMELVDGVDLATWVRRDRPPPARILEAARAAGRGLAAAHAAGIVHRDFKPENVLVARDGTVRVTDFGLARSAGTASDRGAEPTLVLDADLTRTGTVMGTPAYMAPEQIDGESASPAADQFSYCVALFELVHGVRPFAGASLGELRAAIARQELTSVPAGAASRRVAAAIRRGLREDPAARHASMTVLLDELAPPRSHRRTLIGAGIFAVVVTGGLIALDRGAAPAEPCTTGPGELAAVWDPDARAAAIARIATLGPYGRVLAPALDAQLRDHAARWAAGHRDACLANHRGVQSDALLDRRMACLARGRAALGTVAEIVGGAGASALPEVALAVRALPEPAACADVAALLADVAPPAPGIAANAAALRARIEGVRVQLIAGRFAVAATAARAAIADARALGYPPLVADALVLAGRAALAMDRGGDAVPLLAEAVAIAFAAGADALAIEAWARRAYILGVSSSDGAALAGGDVVQAIAARRPDAAFARALLDNNIGAVENQRGEPARAIAAFERALATAAIVRGPDEVELIAIRRNLASATPDPARREAMYAEIDASLTRLVGADHPSALLARAERAAMTVRVAEAIELFAASCPRHDLHDSPAQAAACWTELGFLAAELGDRGRAIAALEQAARRRPEHTGVAAYLALWRGENAAAIRGFSAALVARAPRGDAPWWERAQRAELELGLGRAQRAAGDLPAARASLASSIAALERLEQHRGARAARPRAPIAAAAPSARARPRRARVRAGEHAGAGDRARAAGIRRARLVRAHRRGLGGAGRARAATVAAAD